MAEKDQLPTEATVQQSIIQQAEAAAAANHDPTGATIDADLLHETDSISAERADNEDMPPPPYGDIYGQIRTDDSGLGTSALVTDDGRVNIRVNQLNRRLSQVFSPALSQHIQDAQGGSAPPPPYIPPSLGGGEGIPPPPPLSVVIHVVGSRGDVQPFIALGKVLKSTYGHRVRLATHPNFKDFVEDHDLEFFNIGGDPSLLMAFMVKNPGLIGVRSIVNGDVTRRRRDVAEYIQGCWRSCYQAGDGMGHETGEEASGKPGSGSSSVSAAKPFVADCIIANPPSFAHIHCAEKLGIPLHIMFTMPYSPTQAFPHPLANISSSNADPQLTNYISYSMIELLSWQGLGDIINRFRVKCLGLDPVSLVWAPGMLQRLKIPYTYCWSPALIPKPKDWGPHISISGFHFLKTSNYTPADDLQEFLNAGPAPVYIGFGSIVLDNPDATTELIFQAVKKSGQRALVSKGWGGIGATAIPDNVFMLGNVPHDWLFNHVSCVVHHGGAGTTAAGIAAGRPTIIVPFFGDQPFWGSMVEQAGAGPSPIPHKQLTADSLADAINFCLKPETMERARDLASSIAAEQGNDTSAMSFHQFLEPDRLRCALAPSRAATWRIKRTQINLSAFAACTLANANLLDFNDLKLFRSRDYETDEGPWDPITGGFVATCGAFGGMAKGLADIPTETYKALQLPFTNSRQKSQTSLRTTKSEDTIGNADSQASATQTSPGQSQTSSDAQGSSTRIRRKPVPRSNSANDSQSESNVPQNSKTQDMIRESVPHTSKGVGGFVRAVVEGPMDVSMGISKGLYNLPKLWGDDTVRRSSQVTDFSSGAKAAGKEFGLGFYDGITGLVTQPYRGARKEGTSGFFKGIGRGIGGLVTKPGGAMFGLPAYMMKGVQKELQSRFTGDVQTYIVTSRTTQGYEEWLRSSETEKQDVIARWSLIHKYLKKSRYGKDNNETIRAVLEVQQKMRSGNDGTTRQTGQDMASTVASLGSSGESYSLEAEASRQQDPQTEREIQEVVSQLERPQQELEDARR